MTKSEITTKLNTLDSQKSDIIKKIKELNDKINEAERKKRNLKSMKMNYESTLETRKNKLRRMSAGSRCFDSYIEKSLYDLTSRSSLEMKAYAKIEETEEYIKEKIFLWEEMLEKYEAKLKQYIMNIENLENIVPEDIESKVKQKVKGVLR